MPKELLAKNLEDGQCFRKLGKSTQTYIKISKSAVKFHKLDETKVYGVAYNGNMTAMDPYNTVYLSFHQNMLVDQAEESAWNRTFSKSDWEE